MPTIDSPRLITQLMENHGIYPGDPQVQAIFSYKTQEGQRTFFVAYTQDDITKLLESPWCQDVKLLWSLKQLDFKILEEN